MKENKSVTIIPCKIKDFFKYWVEFTKPFHKLKDKECRLLSVLLCKRYELSKLITDDSLIDNYLFSTEVRNELMKELNASSTQFNVSLTLMRQAGILSKENILHKRYIPYINLTGNNNYNLLYQFQIEE